VDFAADFIYCHLYSSIIQGAVVNTSGRGSCNFKLLIFNLIRPSCNQPYGRRKNVEVGSAQVIAWWFVSVSRGRIPGSGTLLEPFVP
jgi:hypothetical protein